MFWKLVMGSADPKGHAGLVKTPEKLFKHKPGPLPDTLQAAPCIFPPWGPVCCGSTHVSCCQFLPAYQYGSCFGCLVSGPLRIHSHKDRSPFGGHFCESTVFRLRLKWARSILALKLSVTTTIVARPNMRNDLFNSLHLGQIVCR